MMLNILTFKYILLHIKKRQNYDQFTVFNIISDMFLFFQFIFNVVKADICNPLCYLLGCLTP